MAFLPGPTDFVNRMLYSNCQVPFYIYVQTAIPAFVEAAFMLRLFDLNDIVRARGSYLASRQPGKARGFGHGRFLSGRELPKEKPHKGYKQGLKHLLALTQPLEHIGFALLLFGAVDHFYTRWMMYLDDAQACDSPDNYGPLVRRTNTNSVFPNAGGASVRLPILVTPQVNWPSTQLAANVPLGRYTAVLAVSVQGPSNGATYSIELRATNVIGNGIFNSGAVFCAPDVGTDLVVSADLFFPLLTGGQISWFILGPGVPIGLTINSAEVVIFRHRTAFDTES